MPHCVSSSSFGSPLLLTVLRIEDKAVIYYIAAGFLLSLIGIGIVFRNFSDSSRDYFCANGQAKWWLVGGSLFMQSFSAWTFTGAAGAAFNAGWSVMVMYGAGVVANLLIAAFTGPWFRRLRVTTPADTIRLRFGSKMEQFYSYLQLIAGLMFSSTQLLALAIFTSALLGFPVWAVIVALGVVVLCYTVLSGAWAVLAADFVQALILVPVTILLALVCLHQVGGLEGLRVAIAGAGLEGTFKPLKSLAESKAIPGISAGYFTLGFFFAWYLNTTVQSNSFNMCGKFLAVKDDREARKAALLTAGLTLLAMVVFFIPPMVARLLIPNEIATLGLDRPAEGAYAGIALYLLPTGLVGLVLVAMCAATMSSLDGGLTGLAAIITQNAYPAICRRLGKEPVSGRTQLLLGRAVNLGCAIVVISIAIFLSQRGGDGVFSLVLEIIAVLLAPVAVPFALGVFLRGVPGWVPAFAIISALVVALSIAFLPGLLHTEPWLYHHRIFAVIGTGMLTFLGGRAFGGKLSGEVLARETAYFALRDRPINFMSEVGSGNDLRQLRTIAIFSWILSAVLLLLMLPESSSGHEEKFLGLAGTSLTVGVILWVTARRPRRAASFHSASSG